MDDAVEDFANELNREDLHIGQLLGGGEFAEVYRGTLNKNFKKVDVAIKTLRVRSLSEAQSWVSVFTNFMLIWKVKINDWMKKLVFSVRDGLSRLKVLSFFNILGLFSSVKSKLFSFHFRLIVIINQK